MESSRPPQPTHGGPRSPGRALVFAALVTVACSGTGAQEGGSDAGAGGSAPVPSVDSGATEGGTPDVCAERLAPRAGTEPRSFEADIMPIFGLSCNFGSCHGGTSAQGHILLGPQCTYDDATGGCVYAPGSPTAEEVETVYQALLGPSLRGGDLPRVMPGEPAQSYLLIKLADCQDAWAETVGCMQRCGGPMPPTQPFFRGSPQRFRTLIEWVTEGAPR